MSSGEEGFFLFFCEKGRGSSCSKRIGGGSRVNWVRVVEWRMRVIIGVNF